MVLKFLYHSRLDTDLTVEDSEETKTGMVQLTQQQLEYMLMVQSSDLQENGLKFLGYNPFEYSYVNTNRKYLSGTRETFAIYTPDSRVRYVNRLVQLPVPWIITTFFQPRYVGYSNS